MNYKGKPIGLIMRLNKHEARAYRAQKMEKALKGSGTYVFENITKGDLMLPKATASGQTKVAVGQSFQGDDYFMQLVKDHQCRLVKTLISPEQAKQNALKLEQSQQNQKLILDQPNMVTESGQVELVADDQQLNESPVETEQVDKLINESPIDGIDIVLE